jgi:hypothetical protein
LETFPDDFEDDFEDGFLSDDDLAACAESLEVYRAVLEDDNFDDEYHFEPPPLSVTATIGEHVRGLRTGLEEELGAATFGAVYTELKGGGQGGSACEELREEDPMRLMKMRTLIDLEAQFCN